MKILTFQDVQRSGEIAPAPRVKPVVRVARDGAEIREALLSAGVLRPAGSTPPAPESSRAGVVEIDAVGLRYAAVDILFKEARCLPHRLALIMAQSDERLRASLLSLAERHGVRLA